ncbi:YhcH/YjgK/YiaL family protein [Vibrio sp. CDRSL-10 TSBA]
MFTGRWDNLQRYPYIKNNLKHIVQQALKVIEEQTKPGNIVLQPDDVWIEMKHVNTDPADGRMFEIHKQFIDVHVLLEGEEYMGFAHDELVVEDLSLVEHDVYFGSSREGRYFLMKPGELAVFFPGEVHKPQCHLGDESVSLRKAVIKIRQSILQQEQ